MTYSIYDINGYIGPLASGRGLSDMEELIGDNGKALKSFFRKGYSTDLEGLAAELDKLPVIRDRTIKGTVANFKRLVKKCDGVVIISDGVLSDEAQVESNTLTIELHGGPGSGNWGHAGRPGEVGGSAPGGSGGSASARTGASAGEGGQLPSTAATAIPSPRPQSVVSPPAYDVPLTADEQAFKDRVDEIREGAKSTDFRIVRAASDDTQRSDFVRLATGSNIKMSLGKVNNESANLVVEEFVRTCGECPEEVLNITEIRAESAKDMPQGAYASIDQAHGILRVNADYWNRVGLERSLDDSYMTDEALGYHPTRYSQQGSRARCSAGQAVLTHEVGHEAFNDKSGSWNRYCQANPKDLEEISIYACKSGEEAQAEVYTAIKTGGGKYDNTNAVKEFKQAYWQYNGRALA